MAKKAKSPKQVKALKHEDAKRKNIPTAELQSAAQRAEEINPVEPVVYKREKPLAKGETRPRETDLDPQMTWKGTRVRLTKDQIKEVAEKGYIDLDEAQLVWRGKDQQDWSDLVVQAPPLYIQEKIHPKAIIDSLMKQTEERKEEEQDDMFDLFHDFNGIDPEAKTEFYEHDQNWSNRMILGDSLQVMASLAEREGLRGQVQCIYFDPPYGIKFNSNWQVSTRSRDVKDGKLEEVTREPEQVKAFRDTWKDGIHSYLTYMRDRLTAMRDLLTDSGSMFVQIGDENVHRVRTLLDELFGEENFVSCINYRSMSPLGATNLTNVYDHILWYAKSLPHMKYRNIYQDRDFREESEFKFYSDESGHYFDINKLDNEPDDLKDRVFKRSVLMSSGFTPTCFYPFNFEGKEVSVANKSWRTHATGMERLIKSNRLIRLGKSVYFRQYHNDFGLTNLENTWTDTAAGFSETKTYVVQTHPKIVQRCMLMATDPGDLVLDPTCGSGTTATVAEQWGRRWITIDTSRVALALARTRLMANRYPYYYLSDSIDGREQEQKISGKIQPDTPALNNIRQGFVYHRKARVYLKDIANNAEIDVIWQNHQEELDSLRQELNKLLKEKWEEFDVPRETSSSWSDEAQKKHEKWWDLRCKRQREIDKSIAQKADTEVLYDRPYEDKNRVRVAGPFTFESLSPHRVVPSDEIELIEDIEIAEGKRKSKAKKVGEPLTDFTQMVIDNLRTAGVQQGAKEDKINFNSIEGWPGDYIAAKATFTEGSSEKKAAIFIGPEFGTVNRADLTAAAREANDNRYDVLIACGFNFEAHTSELNKLGPLPILKAKMNPDLHMSDELKNTGAGNLFIVFGEPDVEWDFDDNGNIVVEVLGVDVFDPKTGDIRASGKDEIAAWFIDTDYNEESFFVRHAYFLGAQDPYKALKTSLKAEIDKEAWETLYRDKSRPFPRPENGRFAVKVINHFGDEVMKVFAV